MAPAGLVSVDDNRAGNGEPHQQESTK